MRAPRRLLATIVILTAGRLQAAPPAATRADARIDFARDVRPILARRCFECHGAETQESDLRLDSLRAILKGGKSGRPAVVAGKSGQSRLVEVVTGRDSKVQMPPDGARLTADEIQAVARWIDQGARVDERPGDASVPRATASFDGAAFWSFRPVRAVSVPRDADPWIENPVDAFVRDQLRAKTLAPSRVADRRSLIRRLYFDVLGLPPSPEEVGEFTADAEGLAWNRLVDRVLSSPHYGERWARHWLDVVRFAETDGFETNVERPNAFRYRDYVICAWNDDKPYDRFVIEQIAGDSVGADAATGFLVGGPCDRVKSPDVVLTRMQRQDELTDMINATGTAFLALTLGCAKCHDHKFDPIAQRDFYAVQAVFAGVQHAERPIHDRLVPPPARPVMAYAGRFDRPEPVHRLFRGDPMLPREAVSPGGVAVLGALEIAPTAPEMLRRLELARWIARRENPLAARVIVNRLWHYHFGRGIVDTPSDFGHNGGRPSHPELLDWLAGELVRSGWSLKHVQRLILTSNTYRQAAGSRRDGLAIDAATRFLWRFPSRRLEAEAIRDSILASSGALDCRMGGPGFSAFEPNTNYVRVYKPKERFGPAEWRRMVYMAKVRMEQDAVFGVFDCPDGGLTAPRRSQSTTALQALGLLNSGFVNQQAELMAARIERVAGADADRRVRRAFAIALGREPDAVESAGARRLVDAAGMASLCRALLNSNEFLFMP